MFRQYTSDFFSLGLPNDDTKLANVSFWTTKNSQNPIFMFSFESNIFQLLQNYLKFFRCFICKLLFHTRKKNKTQEIKVNFAKVMNLFPILECYFHKIFYNFQIIQIPLTFFIILFSYHEFLFRKR